MTPVYVDTSLVAISEQIAWRRHPFMAAAQVVAAREGGLPDWKIAEIAQSLETVFRAGINDGETYEDAIGEMMNAIR